MNQNSAISLFNNGWTVLDNAIYRFLRVKPATALARLGHRNFVHLSITRVDQSKTVQARITKSLPNRAVFAWHTTDFCQAILSSYKIGRLCRLSGIPLRMMQVSWVTVGGFMQGFDGEPVGSQLWLAVSADRRVSVWSADWSRDSCELVDWLTFPAPAFTPDGMVAKCTDSVRATVIIMMIYFDY